MEWIDFVLMFFYAAVRLSLSCALEVNDHRVLE